MRRLQSVLAVVVFVTGFSAAGYADEGSISNTVAQVKSAATNAAIAVTLLDFGARKKDLAGKLVKFEFARRETITQVEQGIYQTRISIGRVWGIKVIFEKDGLDWFTRHGSADRVFAIVLEDTPLARKASSGDYYYGGDSEGFYGADFLLIGRLVKYDYHGKPTYTW